MTKHINALVLSTLFCLLAPSCGFLDVVPDDVPTVDNAFVNRFEMERYMYGCFSYLPNYADPSNYPGFYGCDELWLSEQNQGVNLRFWNMSRGEQGTNNPIYNCWASRHSGWDLEGGSALFTAINECNVFLDNASKPMDIDDEERMNWISNIKFLKAFYHFLLMRQYGAVPIMDKNVEVYEEKIVIRREPIDAVADYIADLLDEAIEGLPTEIFDQSNYMGFPTVAIAKAVKAQVLTWAASPLFNGNTDYAGIKDDRGIELFPQEYSEQKWVRAAEALREAIESAKQAGHELYDFKQSQSYRSELSDATVYSLQSRAAVVERWNKEIIWGDSRTNTKSLQQMGFPIMDARQTDGGLYRCLAPPLHIVGQFYTKNGVPIEEDKDWQGVDPLGLTTSGAGDLPHIKSGTKTINLHLGREPRFYGAISFDGSRYFGNGKISKDDDVWYIGMKNTDPNGGSGSTRHSATGYQCKKVVHYLSTVPATSSSGLNMYSYAFPIIRMADLYLMYAEALNEYKASPDSEVYEYVDLIRRRSGLEGVVESWSDHSVEPTKPLSKEGMREIIQKERLIELSFEGHRIWDLRRWKLGEAYLNREIQSLDLKADNVEDMYKPLTIFKMSFGKKDYLWPIKQDAITRNPNLVQNLGW